ncbi:hypothetical protein OIE67_43085 [Nonomuraea fuscirosea]|jgi:hypothetical protein|uniref:hypothetical protein n=1 Tax=Nonomuraea fuscirosea TaxID=1291556 RepID=UPI002DDC6AD3|nr:hypothetical protein [Nonomuraea fuscirosea]WSA50784.1 hypothetical protein OIE67_43085 [Nonomuraea fuscirosea]
MKKKIIGIVTLLGAAAMVALTPGTANAEPWPSGCDSGFGYRYRYTWAQCTGGSGSVRAIATCAKGSARTTVYGPWVGIGASSAAFCPTTHPLAVAYTYGIRQ